MPFKVWQDKLKQIDNWDDLLKMLFSESDEAEATVTSHGQHGVAAIRVWVKVTNLDHEGTDHDGTYWRWHQHKHRD